MLVYQRITQVSHGFTLKGSHKTPIGTRGHQSWSQRIVAARSEELQAPGPRRDRAWKAGKPGENSRKWPENARKNLENSQIF